MIRATSSSPSSAARRRRGRWRRKRNSRRRRWSVFPVANRLTCSQRACVQHFAMFLTMTVKIGGEMAGLVIVVAIVSD